MAETTPPLQVLSVTPRKDQAAKPRELIQITGHQSLSLVARRAITILWHNAHRQGISENKSYTIELSELRPHNSNNNGIVEEAIISLMQTIISVTHSDGSITRVQFLGGNNMQDPKRPAGTFSYNFDRYLIQILQDSTIWGKISLPILMAFSTKYAVSFYENLAQWSGLTYKTSETIPLDKLRQLLGVEATKYPTFGEFSKHVLKPAVAEINALAPFNVSVLPIKTGRKVTHARIGWWDKSIDEHKAAYQELHRSKVGRKARIQGQTEHVHAPAPGLAYTTHKKL